MILNSENYGIMGLIALVLAVIIGIALIVLVRKGKISAQTLHDSAELIEAMPVPQGDTIFDIFLRYARTAVLTVEQLVKVGKVEKTNDARKEAAMEIVERAAKVEGFDFNEDEKLLADDCVEACVHELPRNQ